MKLFHLPPLMNRLWLHIEPRRRLQFMMLLVLMVFTSFAEILSIGAVMPFLGVLTVPERILEHPAARPLIELLGITTPIQLLLPLTALFVIAALLAGAFRIVMLWFSTRLSFATGADLSINIYRRTLYQPYAVHVARNSSEVIAAISTKTHSVIYSTLLPSLNLISSVVMLVAILTVLLSINPEVAIAAFFGFACIYAIVIYNVRKHLRRNSECIARESTQVLKCLQEGLGGIRDVLLHGSQATYCAAYREADLPMRRAQGGNAFISLSPRFAMEAFGMVLIACLGYVLTQQPGGVAGAIPVLGTLAIGAQRLLPILQQAYAAWAHIKGGQDALRDTLKLLDQPMPDYAGKPTSTPLKFLREIRLENLSFQYTPDAPWVLRNFNLTIRRGARVGFVGTTGSGKSTLLDIVMGLLFPAQGTLKIDDQVLDPSNQRAWQAHIAHVPQTIYLSDSTITENIAFGIPPEQIDHQRVRLAAQQAQLAELIEGWPRKYDTFVGERGVRLSGGQRQRIGIARALYRQADVIIFDEATSALDNETERAVMEAIDGLSKDLTILIIAHRLTTIQNCDQVVDLSHQPSVAMEA
jgi:ABC-type multidrug transport system fused ATPase/permease subunit